MEIWINMWRNGYVDDKNKDIKIMTLFMNSP